MRGPAPTLRTSLPPLALAAALLACSTEEIVMNTGVPGVAVRADIEVLAERGDYLDAVVRTGGRTYRFFFPNRDDCRALLADPEARFRLDGIAATVRTESALCDAVGILSLRAWRDRQGRAARQRDTAGTRSLVTRDRIEYQVFYRDPDLFLARGRFRLAAEIGWPVGVDTVAAFPSSEECAGVRENVRGTMEFRETGPEPFTVLDGSTLCPVLGFAQPLD